MSSNNTNLPTKVPLMATPYTEYKGQFICLSISKINVFQLEKEADFLTTSST